MRCLTRFHRRRRPCAKYWFFLSLFFIAKQECRAQDVPEELSSAKMLEVFDREKAFVIPDLATEQPLDKQMVVRLLNAAKAKYHGFTLEYRILSTNNNVEYRRFSRDFENFSSIRHFAALPRTTANDPLPLRKFVVTQMSGIQNSYQYWEGDKKNNLEQFVISFPEKSLSFESPLENFFRTDLLSSAIAETPSFRATLTQEGMIRLSLELSGGMVFLSMVFDPNRDYILTEQRDFFRGKPRNVSIYDDWFQFEGGYWFPRQWRFFYGLNPSNVNISSGFSSVQVLAADFQHPKAVAGIDFPTQIRVNDMIRCDNYLAGRISSLSVIPPQTFVAPNSAPEPPFAPDAAAGDGEGGGGEATATGADPSIFGQMAQPQEQIAELRGKGAFVDDDTGDAISERIVFPSDPIKIGALTPGEKRVFALRLTRPGFLEFETIEKAAAGNETTLAEYDVFRSNKTMHFYTVQYAAPEATGPVKDRIAFRSADGERELLTVTIEGEVVRPLGVYPEKLLVLPASSEYELIVAPRHHATDKREKVRPTLLRHTWESDLLSLDGLSMTEGTAYPEHPDLGRIALKLSAKEKIPDGEFAAGELTLVFKHGDREWEVVVPITQPPTNLTPPPAYSGSGEDWESLIVSALQSLENKRNRLEFFSGSAEIAYEWKGHACTYAARFWNSPEAYRVDVYLKDKMLFKCVRSFEKTIWASFDKTKTHAGAAIASPDDITANSAPTVWIDATDKSPSLLNYGSSVGLDFDFSLDRLFRRMAVPYEGFLNAFTMESEEITDAAVKDFSLDIVGDKRQIVRLAARTEKFGINKGVRQSLEDLSYELFFNRAREFLPESCRMAGRRLYDDAGNRLDVDIREAFKYEINEAGIFPVFFEKTVNNRSSEDRSTQFRAAVALGNLSFDIIPENIFSLGGLDLPAGTVVRNQIENVFYSYRSDNAE